MTSAGASYFNAYAAVLGAEAASDYVAEMKLNIRQLADIIERAEDYHVDFVVRAIYAMSAAQRKVEELQSPIFGPD